MTATDDRLHDSRADRWPALARVPAGPRARISAQVARRLFVGAVGRLPVSVTLLDSPGRVLTVGTGGPEMTVHRPAELFARLGADGLIGFGEAYLSGAWDAEDLGGFLAVLASELPRLVPAPLQRLRSAHVRRPPRHQRASLANARDNVAHHYDLSNDLFALFLDPTLTYSSALFDTSRRGRSPDPAAPGNPSYAVAAPPHPQVTARDLAEAQGRKIDRLLDLAGVGPGTRLLEIGTGWGELAVRAARRGARVHTITLSAEQRALAQDRLANEGLDERVRVDLLDYREVTGTYDAVVSVEMIEAVGHDYWRTYLETLDRVLAPGGRVALQAITMPHDRMLATRRTWTWINKYVFPGGFLPSVEALDRLTRDHTTLRIRDRLSFGRHYAATLRQWDRAFLAQADAVRSLGFDEVFCRMWHFYLEYSRAGFASGYLDVNQLLLTRE